MMISEMVELRTRIGFVCIARYCQYVTEWYAFLDMVLY